MFLCSSCLLCARLTNAMQQRNAQNLDNYSPAESNHPPSSPHRYQNNNANNSRGQQYQQYDVSMFRFFYYFFLSLNEILTSFNYYLPSKVVKIDIFHKNVC